MVRLEVRRRWEGGRKVGVEGYDQRRVDKGRWEDGGEGETPRRREG